MAWYTLCRRGIYPNTEPGRFDLMFCGHTHRYSYQQKGENGNNFSILTNSNKEILEIQVKGEKITIKISNTQGKLTKTIDL